MIPVPGFFVITALVEAVDTSAEVVSAVLLAACTVLHVFNWTFFEACVFVLRTISLLLLGTGSHLSMISNMTKLRLVELARLLTTAKFAMLVVMIVGSASSFLIFLT